MEIVATDKATNARYLIRKNSNNVYTTNLTTNLIDVLTAYTKTTNYNFYYASTANWASRAFALGRTGVTTVFADFTQPSTVNNQYKLKYNSANGSWYFVTSVYYYRLELIQIGGPGIATNFNTHNEYLIPALFTTTISSSNNNQITYSTSTYIYSITTTLPKLFLVKCCVFFPLSSTSLGSEFVFRIRQTNITGTILSEMKYRNTATSGVMSHCANVFVENPNALCFTIQLVSGTVTYTSGNLNSGTLKVLITEVY